MPVSPRERKYSAMRCIDKWVNSNREQERKLVPPYGTIGVGGADFDYLLKTTAGEAYLRVLRRNGTPEEAHEEAIADGNHCVDVWNERTSKTRASVNGVYELKQWNETGKMVADDLHLWFLSLIR